MRKILAAVETANPQVIHAVRADLGPFSIASCGYLGEYLRILPASPWDDVPTERRCPHCNDKEQFGDAVPVQRPVSEPPLAVRQRRVDKDHYLDMR